MAVYVDDFNTTAELLEICKRIGVPAKWIQYPGDYKEHFDICLSKKKKAIAAGAIEITSRELARMTRERRLNGILPAPMAIKSAENKL